MRKIITLLFLLIALGVEAQQTPQYLPLTGGTMSGALSSPTINNVINAASYSGATADVKLAAACGALAAAGGTIDARAFSASTQTIVSTVSCGSASKPVTFLFDPATVFQPSTVSTNMFAFGQNNIVSGLHIDTTNQAIYSGNAISNSAQGITALQMSNILINEASGSTGTCLTYSATSSTVFVQFTEINNLVCVAGTAAIGVNLQNSGGGWVNSNHFYGLKVYNAKYGVEINQSGTADITGNQFYGYEYEAGSLATALAGVHIDAAGAGHAHRNQFYFDTWDLTGANKGVIITSASNACGNLFFGTVSAISDGGTSCTVPNQFNDLFGSIGTVYQLGYMNITQQLTFASGATLQIGGNIVYRCTTAGTLPIGALTIATGNCGASTDTGLRVR